MYDHYLDDGTIPSPEEFVSQLAEEGYGHERNPDRVPFYELWGSWETFQELVWEARMVASTLMADDDTPAARLVREVARKARLADRVASEDMDRAEGELTREELVAAFLDYREFEAQAIAILSAPALAQ
jgi:hypothetical protein